jgi:ribonuclease P protein component
MFLLKNKMLPKKKRVTKKDFDVLIKNGKVFSSPLFLFYFIKTEEPKFGVVAPKKTFKKAFKRNKYRRIVFNVLKDLKLKGGSALFVYKNQLILPEKDQIKKEVIFLLSKNSLI